MDATTWLTISIIGYSLAGVLFVVSVYLFIKMNIPAVIGNLTGRTAAKQIREIREQTSSESKRHTPSPLERITRGRSGRLGKTGPTKGPQSMPPVPDTVLLGSEATELLVEETDVLTSPVTEELYHGDLEETTVLDATVVLDSEEPPIPTVAFKIVKDIKVTHTSEVI